MKKITYILITGFFLTSLLVFGQTEDYEKWLLQQRLPDGFSTKLKIHSLDSSYELSNYINPFYLFADFNGDMKNDIAIAVIEKKTYKRGFIIFHQNTNEYYIIGAGESLKSGGDDFSWLNIWKVYTNQKIEPGVGETVPVDLKANAIYVAKAEAASAVIYWTGKKYEWYQQGD